MLADFSTDRRAIGIAALALVVGACSAGVALGLLDLIGLITHVLYYGNVGVGLVPPTLSHAHAYTALIPVGGGLIIGAMAYFGSERIRGHGIPEAMETILVGGSKVEPRLAILKPISSAISIGTGGPFGAEGPIILTGGAVGSVLAQHFHLSATERRTLLVAGACGGMAAVFGTPVAATLFGVELLVFEWRPRSMAPIALAVVVASILRGVMAAHGLVQPAPLFPVTDHAAWPAVSVLASAGVGLCCAALAVALTGACYGMEDLFRKLPIHWAFWPAIGGVVVGLGGLIEPRALGVGYAQISAELGGRLALGALLLLLVMKLVMWSVALGSGTSGGILAPLLIMGAAMGGLLAPVLPGGSSGTWALIAMAGTLAGVTRSPFTAVVFAFELTRDTGTLLPLLCACAIAHLVSSLVLKRSILTEKVARKGFHVMREYAVDPLEALYVRDAMLTDVLATSGEESVAEVLAAIRTSPSFRHQRFYPLVVDGQLAGGVGFSDLLEAAADADGSRNVAQLCRRQLVLGYADETLRDAADRMAEQWLGALPIVERSNPDHLVGVLTEFDMLKARQRLLVAERHRERVLRLWSVGDGTRRGLLSWSWRNQLPPEEGVDVEESA